MTGLPRPATANRIEHRIDVAAPADRVRAVLADIAGWTRWNPVYPRCEGTLAPGETIALTVVLPDSKPVEAQAVVLEASGTRLAFHSDIAGGLVRATRVIEIQPRGEGCTLVGHESFGGPLGWLLVRAVGKKVRVAIEAVNVALKREVVAGN